MQTPEDIRSVFIANYFCRVPLGIKMSQRDVPTLRRAVKTPEGFITSPTLTLQYLQIPSQNIDLGIDAGFENEIYFYTLRRRAGEALNIKSQICPG
jgi:hypothetical protein